MIHYLVTRDERWLVDHFLARRGRALRGVLRPQLYERALNRRWAPAGHWVFADVDRLGPRDAERAARLWQELVAAGAGRVLNHPTRVLRRYELLRRLHDAGINRSDVYRVTEARVPRRWPVFVRREGDHRGALTALLRGPDELAAALAAMDQQAVSRDDAIICEFCESSDARGIYTKYGTFLVAGRVIPRHVFFHQQWQVKGVGLLDDALVREEAAYLDANPHDDVIRRVFALAQIEYGRIDYSVRPDGGIEVWEINTHPTLPMTPGPGDPVRSAINDRAARKLVEAFQALNAEPSRTGRIPTGHPGRAQALMQATRGLAARVARKLRRAREPR
ncbi:MAG TPA: hypothetical protein VFM14_18855 [Gemmatimonadales bacterium]|nr:hypothetical protein [Gemmatimonadales bacterium]